jgi:hypothetical protein
VTLSLSRLTANGEHWLLDRKCDALSVARIGGMDAARRMAVVIPLDDSFPARAEAAGRLFNALTGRTPDRTPNALTAQQRRRLGLMLRMQLLISLSYFDYSKIYSRSYPRPGRR